MSLLAPRTPESTIGRTSDVALECQVWEQDGELQVRWDVAVGRLPAGTAETAFARVANDPVR